MRLPPVLDGLALDDAVLRVAWFQPTFHPECGVVLRSNGVCAFFCVVRSPRPPDLLGFDTWLTPLWSGEPLTLPPPERQRLLDAFAALASAPRQGVRQWRDGCGYRVEVRAEIARVWEGNLAEQWPPSLALAQAIVEIAASCATWRSTRQAFEALARYLH